MKRRTAWALWGAACLGIIVAAEPMRFVEREARIAELRAEAADARARLAALEARWARAHAPARLRAQAYARLDVRPPHTDETTPLDALPWRARADGAYARVVFPIRGAYVPGEP